MTHVSKYYLENARTLNHVQDIEAGGKNTAYPRLKYITNGFFLDLMF